MTKYYVPVRLVWGALSLLKNLNSQKVLLLFLICICTFSILTNKVSAPIPSSPSISTTSPSALSNSNSFNNVFNLSANFPKNINGENGIYLQYLAYGNYTDLPNRGDYYFGIPTTDGSIIVPQVSMNAEGIFAHPGAVSVSGHEADTVIRVTIPGDGGLLRVSGTALMYAGASNSVRFYIYIGEDQYNNPIYSANSGGVFNFTLSYEKGQQIFFVDDAGETDNFDWGYWKDVLLTIDTQTPSATPQTTSSPNPQTTPTIPFSPSPPFPTQTQSFLASERYFNRQFGWSIVPPNGWRIDDSNATSVAFIGPVMPEGQGTIGFGIIVQKTNQPLSQYVSDTLRSAQSMESSYKFVSQDNLTVFGMNGTEVEISTVKENLILRWKIAFFIADGTAYNVLYIASDSTYGSNMPLFEQSLQTFEVGTTPPLDSNLFLLIALAIVIMIIVSAILLYVRHHKSIQTQKQILQPSQTRAFEPQVQPLDKAVIATKNGSGAAKISLGKGLGLLILGAFCLILALSIFVTIKIHSTDPIFIVKGSAGVAVGLLFGIPAILLSYRNANKGSIAARILCVFALVSGFLLILAEVLTLVFGL